VRRSGLPGGTDLLVEMSDLNANPRGPAAFQIDYTDRNGAEQLKARIESYWRERGYDIEVWFVEGSFTMALRASRVDVRSELVNGLPRASRKIKE